MLGEGNIGLLRRVVFFTKETAEGGEKDTLRHSFRGKKLDVGRRCVVRAQAVRVVLEEVSTPVVEVEGRVLIRTADGRDVSVGEAVRGLGVLVMEMAEAGEGCRLGVKGWVRVFDEVARMLAVK